MGILIEGRPAASSECHKNQVKSSICGIYPLANFLSLFLMVTVLFTLALILFYVCKYHAINKSKQKSLLLAICIIALYSLIAMLLSLMDIFFDYSNSLYSMFKIHSSLIIIDFGLYLTIWIRLYKSLQQKSQRTLVVIDCITSALLATYSILFILECVGNFTYMGRRPLLRHFIDVFDVVLKFYFILTQMFLVFKTTHSLNTIKTELYTYSKCETKCVALVYFLSLAVWVSIDILKFTVKEEFWMDQLLRRQFNWWLFVLFANDLVQLLPILAYVLFIILLILNSGSNRHDWSMDSAIIKHPGLQKTEVLMFTTISVDSF